MLDVLSYKHWAISQDFANRYGLLALKLLSEGRSIDQLLKKKSQEEITAAYAMLPQAADGLVISTEWDRELRVDVATTNMGQRVAIIPVVGSLTKRGDLCSYGMRDYIGMIERVNKSDKIAAIVLDIESPGGTVDGTHEFGLAVKQSKKPVVAFGDGMVASAAYWVASQAREIVANKNNATEFGSIGVLYVHENYQAYIQKEIGSVEIIRAPQSTDKALVNPIEPLSDELRGDIKAELKEIAKDFFATVKKGRGAKLNTAEENIFTGKMYSTKDALAYGMIDRLDTLQGAINRAGSMVFSNNNFSPARAEANTMFKSKFLSSIFGKAEKAEQEKPAAEQSPMEQVDTHITSLEAENAQLKAEKASATEKVTALEATVAEQAAQITTLTTDKGKLEEEKAALQTKLDAKPNGLATTVVPKEQREEQVNADGSQSATAQKVVSKATAETMEIVEKLNNLKK